MDYTTDDISVNLTEGISEINSGVVKPTIEGISGTLSNIWETNKTEVVILGGLILFAISMKGGKKKKKAKKE